MNIQNNPKQKLLHHYHKLPYKHLSKLEVTFTKCRLMTAHIHVVTQEIFIKHFVLRHERKFPKGP